MQSLEVSGAVRLIYGSLGVKGLIGMCEEKRQTDRWKDNSNLYLTEKKVLPMWIRLIWTETENNGAICRSNEFVTSLQNKCFFGWSV